MPEPAVTSSGWTEILPAYLYDWNQEGSSVLRGGTFVDAEEQSEPKVGRQVVLHGDGMAVVTTVTKVERAAEDDGWFIETTWRHQAAGRVRNAG